MELYRKLYLDFGDNYCALRLVYFIYNNNLIFIWINLRKNAFFVEFCRIPWYNTAILTPLWGDFERGFLWLWIGKCLVKLERSFSRIQHSEMLPWRHLKPSTPMCTFRRLTTMLSLSIWRTARFTTFTSTRALKTWVVLLCLSRHKPI